MVSSCLVWHDHKLKLEQIPPSHDWNYILLMMALVSFACWTAFCKLPIRPWSPLGLGWTGQPVCELLSRRKSYCLDTCRFPVERLVTKMYKNQIASLKTKQKKKNKGERVFWQKVIRKNKIFNATYSQSHLKNCSYLVLFSHMTTLPLSFSKTCFKIFIVSLMILIFSL